MFAAFPYRLRVRLAIGLYAGVCICLPALGQQTSSFEELAQQAAAARDQQRIPQSIDLYTRAEQLRPDWQEGWWYLTVLQYGSSLYGGAIEAASHLLQLAPQAVPAMALRGLSEFELGDYNGALRDLDEAVHHGAANDPRNEQIIRYHLALCLTRAERFQDALEQYRVFARKNVGDAEMLVGLGLAGMRIPALPSAVAPENRAMIQEAGAAGYAFLADHSVDADNLFHALFDKYPTAPNLHLFYGVLLFSHDPLLAAEQLKIEVALAPQSVSSRALLAYALMLGGHFEESLPEAQQVNSAAPDMEMGQIALGRALGETGQLDRGMELLRNVLKTDPDNMEVHLGLASLLAKAGKREEAYRERMACLALAK